VSSNIKEIAIVLGETFPEQGTLRVPLGCYRIYRIREFEERSLYGRSRHAMN
jgi:hypothetical protein